MKTSMPTQIPWTPEAPSQWSVNRAKTLFGRKKVLNADRSEQQILSLTLRGVVENDPDNPEGLVPSDYATYQIFDKDDLVFKLIDLENVRTSRVGHVHRRGIMSSAYLRLSPKPGNCTRYFYWQFFDLYNRRVFNDLGNGVRSTLGGEDVLELPLLVPSPMEQRTIADFLDKETKRIDEIIEKKQRMLQLLESRFVRSGRIRIDAGTTVGSRMPNGSNPAPWVPRKVAWHMSTGSGTTPPSGDPRFYADQGTPWVTTSELREEVITHTSRFVTELALTEFCALKVHTPGTILLAMYGATVGRVGILGVPACVNQACCAIAPLDLELSASFLYWWLRLHREELLDAAYGAGQPNISQDVVRSLRVLSPPRGEQDIIVESIEMEHAKFRAISNRLKIQIDLLSEHRQALITAAVTGQLQI